MIVFLSWPDSQLARYHSFWPHSFVLPHMTQLWGKGFLLIRVESIHCKSKTSLYLGNMGLNQDLVLPHLTPLIGPFGFSVPTNFFGLFCLKNNWIKLQLYLKISYDHNNNKAIHTYNNNNKNKVLVPNFWGWLWILDKLVMIDHLLYKYDYE